MDKDKHVLEHLDGGVKSRKGGERDGEDFIMENYKESRRRKEKCVWGGGIELQVAIELQRTT